ncbi:MAG TPA: DUF1289 domain-containing protein [Stellaceae bacterium]|jgi:predicted Fe-S protein YdhL (DUF1289 family)|nr:DUF1289 domain-containing protein [Stellaceae bacterium]
MDGDDDRPVASPCIRRCSLDPISGFCRSCWRSLDEIVAWPSLDSAAKQRILGLLPQRSGRPAG